ncbi:MAG: succinyl-diaminopimelate desuccinylase [Pseudohongiella sp.]|nr:succinyl-diaminopimelate desuccinylase [Pseudohongiella sp.]MDO9519630.1 succinyl-diaminopimelate desuccinylase [Pseudohongiella sp.]MDP2127675.1 succinyl-diaminopimelate desuccinylase [Pseudohongiella sp.]
MTLKLNSEQLSATAALAVDLIRIPSVTPDDKGCNQLMIDRLSALGFVVEPMRFGNVNNFWARYGSTGPVLCFAGHTDVVPSGPEEKWQSPPFQPAIRDGYLYGRGAADMKGSLAAMITACEAVLTEGQNLNGSIAFLITADEEGAAIHGTREVINTLEAREEKITWCIVGEPSSTNQLGDVVKIGRRGSLHGKLTVHGVQGHVAYPHLARNPIHQAMLPLHDLSNEVWDEGNEAFPPTSFQISNIHSGTGVDNVIPGELEAQFNFRFSTELNETLIRQRTEAILDKYELEYTIEWKLSGLPFLTLNQVLINAVRESIREVNGVLTQPSTTGGTSDGRFIAPTGAEVVELGPCNASIHKIDEHVRLADLDELSKIYQGIIRRLLA